jgi:formamidopyrimidine-DNA glycosylase
MPELPEVETIKNDLRQALIGRRFNKVTVHWPRTVAHPAPEPFQRRLEGQRVLDVGRRGKYLVFRLSGGDYLLIHLKMTGRLLIRETGAAMEPHVRVVFDLDDGRQLRFDDTRKFGRMYLVDDPQTVVGRLGPEPLDFTLEVFASLIARRRGRLKSLLLNQEFLAGLGNIYADEALFAASLQPLRCANTLTPAEVERLYHGIRHVLRQALARRGTTFDGRYRDPAGEAGGYQERLAVYRRAGQPCPRCGTPIERLVVGGRGTFFCPRCQA